MSEFKSVPVEPTAEGAGEMPEGRWVYSSASPKFEGDSNRVRAYTGFIHAGWEDAPEFETSEECYAWMMSECARRNAYEAACRDALRARITPPAPEKLALAVEALELLNDCIWLDTDTGDYRVEHDGSVEKARAIIATIKAST